MSKLWRYQGRVEIIEEEALYEGLPAPYSDLVQDVGEVVLHSVLGDVKGCGYLRDGKAIEHWGVRDELDMMRQLGLIPPPGRGDA